MNRRACGLCSAALAVSGDAHEDRLLGRGGAALRLELARGAVVCCVTVAGCLMSAGAAVGLGWTIQRVPAAKVPNELSGVSCSAKNACTAVGASNITGATPDSFHSVTLAFRWNGNTWMRQRMPNATGTVRPGFSYALQGVSCSSKSACTAVGFTANNTYMSGATLAERWNGATWSVQASPNSSSAYESSLNSVSCSSISACMAVGGSDGGPLAESWDGASWTIAPSFADQFTTAVNSVSCSSNTACTAVGSGSKPDGPAITLAARWNGTTWAIQPTPNPAHAAGSSLSGVACSSPSNCTAVGSSDSVDGYSTATLIERWNGTSWSIQPTPNPSRETRNLLWAVSCSSTKACIAVGSTAYHTHSRRTVTLAERWNGTTWTIQPTPNPKGAQFSELKSVSCASPTVCTAVGNSDGQVALVERYS